MNAGADCVKFQMRNLDSVYRNSSSTINENEDLGAQYVMDLLNKFQLSNDNMLRLFDYCHKQSIMPLCTPWDEQSVEVLDNYGIDGYKIAICGFGES